MTDDFVIYFNADTSTYRCRGTMASEYSRFYNQWVLKSSYRCTYENFPWDHFVFDNPEDHEKLLRDFPNIVENELI